MADQQRPKLELELGKAVEMEMAYDSPKEGDSQYGGKWYAWGVKVGGKEHTFFLPKGFYEVMQDHGVKRGTTITVRKCAGERDGKLINTYDLKIGSKVVMRESVLVDKVEDVGKGEPEREEKGPPTPAAPEGPPPLYVSPRADARLLADYANALALELREWEVTPAVLLEAAQKIVITYLIRALGEGRRIEVVSLPDDEELVDNGSDPEQEQEEVK